MRCLFGQIHNILTDVKSLDPFYQKKSNKIQRFLLLGRLFSSDLIVLCVAERNVLFKGRVGFVLNQHPYYCFRRMNGWGEHCVWGAAESRNCVSEIFIFTFNILRHQMHFRSNLI